jgi:peptidyl-tRNA hydrolase
MAQAIHAAVEFCCEFYDKIIKWNEISKYLVVLSTPDEKSLLTLANVATNQEISTSIFTEPDQTTSIPLWL